MRQDSPYPRQSQADNDGEEDDEYEIHGMVMAMTADVVIAEPHEIVPVGVISPDDVKTPEGVRERALRDHQQSAYEPDPLARRETLELVRAYYKIEDPTRTIIYHDSIFAGSTGITESLQWTVPAGAPDEVFRFSIVAVGGAPRLSVWRGGSSTPWRTLRVSLRSATRRSDQKSTPGTTSRKSLMSRCQSMTFTPPW